MLFIIIKIILLLYVSILIPLYWKTYGPDNFLWISDIALFLTVLGIWINSPLLISMAILGALPFEIAWNVDFFYTLFTKKSRLKVVNYMFNPTYSKFIRALSFFHTVLPIVWFIYLYLWGYDPHALFYQIVVFWIVLIVTYRFTDPSKNINWVFLPTIYHWKKISNRNWLIILMFGIPLFVYLPLHYLLKL